MTPLDSFHALLIGSGGERLQEVVISKLGHASPEHRDRLLTKEKRRILLQEPKDQPKGGIGVQRACTFDNADAVAGRFSAVEQRFEGSNISCFSQPLGQQNSLE